jgi:hypothetical protein
MAGYEVLNVGGQLIGAAIGAGVANVFCPIHVAAATTTVVNLFSNGTCTNCDAPRA